MREPLSTIYMTLVMLGHHLRVDCMNSPPVAYSTNPAQCFSHRQNEKKIAGLFSTLCLLKPGSYVHTVHTNCQVIGLTDPECTVSEADALST